MSLIERPSPTPRSPLKDAPLRHAGQSLDEALDDAVNDALGYAMAAAMGCIFAVMEWWRYYRHDTLHPYIYTIVAVVALGCSAPKIWTLLRKARWIRLGRDGERVVSEFLDQMRKDSYEVLHDVVGGNFNVDHVLVGPAGVYAIETKTRSKSGGTEETIHFDGLNVIIHGKPADPNPVDQAKANARWIRELLKNSTGKNFQVTPVVLFLPGWFVEQKAKKPDVLVLNPQDAGGRDKEPRRSAASFRRFPGSVPLEGVRQKQILTDTVVKPT